MNYHNITKCDMLNGEGIRVVLWVAGCQHACRNCHNPQTWNPNSGIPFDDNALQEIYAELDNPYTDGITFSGGDPLHARNYPTILDLCVKIKQKYPDKTIWLYTGYLRADVERLYGDILNHIDVLVDGKYVEELRCPDTPWIGSSNQIIHRISN